VDVNAVDNIGCTPLHEAVNNNREAAVQLLLDHRPPPTLDWYITVTPVKMAADDRSQRKQPPPGYVSLMAMAGSEDIKFNPLQDAVDGGNINIVRIILGKEVFLLAALSLAFAAVMHSLLWIRINFLLIRIQPQISFRIHAVTELLQRKCKKNLRNKKFSFDYITYYRTNR
jgi:hypothetical protein